MSEPFERRRFRAEFSLFHYTKQTVWQVNETDHRCQKMYQLYETEHNVMEKQAACMVANHSKRFTVHAMSQNPEICSHTHASRL